MNFMSGRFMTFPTNRPPRPRMNSQLCFYQRLNRRRVKIERAEGPEARSDAKAGVYLATVSAYGNHRRNSEYYAHFNSTHSRVPAQGEEFEYFW